jgi:multicomponent Na+:H+ antiporter subunit B
LSRRARLVVFLLGVVFLLPAAARIAWRMPEFGAHPLPYGDAINRSAPAERHVSNMVSAVNFDYRAFDTLGEEFMLVCAVTGAVVLLRGSRGEALTAQPGRLHERPLEPRSDAVVLVCRFAAPVVVLFGIYVALHAMVTPGGGFQGGAIVASGILLLYLGDGYRRWRQLVRSRRLDAGEGGGALVFALAGLLPLLIGARFLQNVLPYGQFADLLSGGLMQVINAGVALAVTAGFLLLFLEFLEETRVEAGVESG